MTHKSTPSGLLDHVRRAAGIVGLSSSTPAESDAEAGTSGSCSAAECQALRQSLLLTQAEAAAWMSGPPVSERAWQYWEAGKRPVPSDVAENLRSACAQRMRLISLAKAAIEQAHPLRTVSVWYAKADDWRWTLRGNGLDWKVHNSAVASLASEGLVRLVGFDEVAYADWSSKLPAATAAGEMARHVRWAAESLRDHSEG